MRLIARTKRLEQRFPPPRKPRESEAASQLLTAGTVEWAVSHGCERHLTARELGKITFGEWLHRLSVDELLVLGSAAHHQMVAESQHSRCQVSQDENP